MTWSTIKSTGRGSWQFRLMIEGWPAEWVTHPSITHADEADGRAVYAGLSYSGIEIRDRILMMEGKVEADGITFRIDATDSNEHPMASFTLYPEPVGFLQTAIDEDDTTLELQGGTELAAGHYHIGTECIEVTASGGGTNTIERTKWGTLAQKHNVANFDRTRWVAVYDSPPTMEGRRAYLFIYGDGDDLDGNGTCIWRGIVSRPPSQVSGEPKSFTIDVQSITAVLKQTVAGKTAEVKPLSLITHHVQCPFVVQMTYDGTTSDVAYVVGAETEAGWVRRISNDLDTIAFTTLSIAELDWIKFDKSKNGNWRVRVKTNALVPDFDIALGSPIFGTVITSKVGWTDKDGNRKTGIDPTGLASGFRLQANKEYFCELVIDNKDAGKLSYRYTGIVNYDGPPMQPLGNASMLMVPAGTVNGRTLGSVFYDADDVDVAELHTNRIWINADLTDFIGGTIHITDTYSPTGIYKILDAGVVVDDGSGFGSDHPGVSTNRYWIEVELYSGKTGSFNGLTQEEINKQILAKNSFDGFITSSTKINAVRDYGTATSVVGFRNNVVANSVNANDGDAPFVTDADLDDGWIVADTITSRYQFSRDYQFVTEHPLEDILAEELKFTCHFPRIEADGRIGILPLPQFADTATTDTAHTIDRSGIITPAGSYGAWPSWEPQRDGILTTVNIKDRYDPLKDDWRDKDIQFRDPDAIATHKSRGKLEMSIAPLSAPSKGVSGDPQKVFAQIAGQYLNFFARDYAIITLRVSFKHFDVLCGDVVTLTHQLIPAGDGTRGVTSRKALCVERRWNMDPASEAYGELSFYLPRTPQKGYAPSAWISAQSDLGSNLWSITCDPAVPVNIRWSTNNDGKMLEHFQDGDFVRVVRVDDSSSTEVTGQVAGTPDAASGTISVQFDATWTPGTNSWVLEFQSNPSDATATTAQKKYAFVADSDLHLSDGSVAQVFP